MTFLSIDPNNKLYEAKLNAENNNKNVSEINKTISDNSIFATNSLQYDLSVDNTNSINQNLFIPDDEIVDSFEYQTSDINANARELYDELEQTREDQGIIGKLWDGFKNLTGLGAGSNKAEDAIKQYENGEISLEEAKEKLNGYQQGQETCVDVVGDIVSGIVAVGAFALAVPTGGTSLIAGLGLAAAAGAGSKIAVKAGDAIMGGREYSGKDLLYDSATGAVNGLFAPVTNGVGACVTKTVGKKLGLTVVKEGTKEVIEQTAKQSIKSIITQQGVDVIGGTFAKRALATASGMAIDGAIGGSTDNMIRAALDGEDAKGIFEAGVQGLAGGLIMSPVIGGGFKVAGKLGKNLNNKITTKALFKDGMNTTFKQGQTGDCALLSFLSGAMNNRETQDTIKKSITKSIGGDYHIRIGNQTIDIPKSAFTDEMLSDTTGIKLFEAAYKKAGGSIDGEFADSVARQFGFNPVHITGDLITDETLDKIAKEQGTILSFGTKIDADGNISLEGANHYFSIKNVDTNKKILTLSDPYDTSKTIELSYDDAKKFGISIDGGSIKETDLPNSIRNVGDAGFRGKYLPEQSKIDAATSILAEKGTPEYDALQQLVDEAFICVKDKESALEIFRDYFRQLSLGDDSAIFVLNPQDPGNAAKNIGTSNSYMTRWYAEANGLDDFLIDAANLSDMVSGLSGKKKAVIVIPDDCAITGRSLIVETAKTLNSVDFPEDAAIDIVFSPLIESDCAIKAFGAMANFDIEELMQTKALNQSDYSIIEEFFEKFKNNKIEIKTSDNALVAKPYYETAYFKTLKKENPELAQALEVILTSKGTKSGYGRPGTSGVMVAMPSSDGVTLKCPNNNVYAATPYALVSGAAPESIKRVSQKTAVRKWHSLVGKMQEELQKILNGV